MPTKENGKWDYRNIVPGHLDSNRVEDWKTLFYELERTVNTLTGAISGAW